MVLMVMPAEAAHVAAPLTITCGKIPMQVHPEPTTFDPSGRTIMSIPLSLATEREHRPDLTIEALIDKLLQTKNADNYHFRNQKNGK